VDWADIRARTLNRIAVDPNERVLAGRISGVLYSIGGTTMGLLAVVPGVDHSHRWVVLGIGVACAAWGVVSLRAIRWSRVPPWLIHVSNLSAFVVIAAAVVWSGESRSPAWIYLFYVVVFAAYFYPRPVAFAYAFVCVAVQALPIAYDGGWLHGSFTANFLISAPAYVALSGAIVGGKELLGRIRQRAEQLAAEQGALRRIATAVAGGEPAERIYERVAREAAAMLDASASGILRFETSDRATVMGSWSHRGGGRYAPGTSVPVRPGSDVAELLATSRPVSVDRHAAGSPVDRLGYASSIVAPVHIDGRVWGLLAVAADNPDQLGDDAARRLTGFGDLLATAVSNTDARTLLAAQASSDPLTGLENHRSFHERLAAELARAVRHNRPLSVALIDIDHFKLINDIEGHEVGDRVLESVAGCLRVVARAEDTLGRIGGDEIAWILPESDAMQAFAALERVRKAITEEAGGARRITVSAGICDVTWATDPVELLQLADGALYWSKAHGRDQAWIYDPEIVHELSAQQRADHLARSQALLGLKALARAIDAKDPVTREHSERVAELAAQLAEINGWTPDRVRMLTEAALVHDVGKIGIPDAVLLKNGPLTVAEFEKIKEHPELGARIVEDVLSVEQVDWIRSHHERPDGRGYPRGLTAAELPEGAALLSVADAWDVMTLSRPYSSPKAPQVAFEECMRLVDRQFTAPAVAALAELYARGGLAQVLGVDGVSLPS
jgi:diguanylate cyclase (GGDEF)-like protein